MWTPPLGGGEWQGSRRARGKKKYSCGRLGKIRCATESHSPDGETEAPSLFPGDNWSLSARLQPVAQKPGLPLPSSALGHPFLPGQAKDLQRVAGPCLAGGTSSRGGGRLTPFVATRFLSAGMGGWAGNHISLGSLSGTGPWGLIG